MHSPLLNSQIICTLAFFLFACGASIGSFLNVVVYRVPLGLSLVRPRSHCPQCKSPVSILGLVPIFGCFIVKGRCQSCHERVSPTYPSIEALSAFGTVGLFFFHFYLDQNLADINATLLEFSLSLWIFFSGIVLALIDIHTQRLPNRITVPGIALSVVLGSAAPSVGLVKCLTAVVIAMGLGAIVLLVFHLFSVKKSLGSGDIKYFVLLAACLGPMGFVWCGLFAALTAILWELMTSHKTRTNARTSARPSARTRLIRFGPFIALGGVFARILTLGWHTF